MTPPSLAGPAFGLGFNQISLAAPYVCICSYLGVLNTTWELRRGLVAYAGTPVLLGSANSTNVVAGEW